jgi:hypothetical protein
MGNRAVVLFSETPDIGVYLHWNGGPESVLAFLQATSERVRAGELADSGRDAGVIGFLQTVANYFSFDGLSLYLGKPADLDCDNGDNGTYHVTAGRIVRREYMPEYSAMSVEGLKRDERERFDGILEQCRKESAALASVDPK